MAHRLHRDQRAARRIYPQIAAALVAQRRANSHSQRRKDRHSAGRIRILSPSNESGRTIGLSLELPKSLTLVPLPDAPDVCAFMDGPVVLAGLCDEERTLVGDIEDASSMLIPHNEREWGNWLPNYRTRNQARGLRFKPLYDIADEAYTVYFPVQPKDKRSQMIRGVRTLILSCPRHCEIDDALTPLFARQIAGANREIAVAALDQFRVIRDHAATVHDQIGRLDRLLNRAATAREILPSPSR